MFRLEVELLFEILTEEIPARMQVAAAEAISNAFKNTFELRVASEIAVESFVTPRRLGFYASAIPVTIAGSVEEVRGPKISAPEAALSGFLSKYKISRDQLEPRGDYYFLDIATPEMSAADVIKDIMESVLNNYVWPKSMRYGEKNYKWVRPVHSMICMLDDQVVPIEFNGIIASTKTIGHRFMAPSVIEVRNFADYRAKLLDAKVVISFSERREKIIAQAEKIALELSLDLVRDEGLIDEIAGLVEFPTVLVGEISESFMHLPEEVLIITLRHHQRYIMLREKSGKLSNRYLIVSNIAPLDRGAEVVRGNSKVLAARLSDAKFFFDQDRKIKLVDRIEELNQLMFHQEIGSVFDKLKSVLELAIAIATYVNADASAVKEAVMLSKCDLVTNMVKEFPELQGVMGCYYAIYDGASPEIAFAIADQYKPSGPADKVPRNAIGAIIAIAEKLDTLNKMFAINIKPTGSKDPYALRRAAIGVLRIEEHYKFALDFQSLGIREDVVKFIYERKVA